MRIAIIETGRPPAALATRHGNYPAMFRRLLGPDGEYETFRAYKGELPDPDAFDAAIVTGSPAGVNDGLPWVDALSDWLRAARGRVRLVGICFGHQVIAHAFGGTVAKADAGWGLGLHRYTLTDGFLPGVAELPAIASHQDQVIVPPPDARVIGSSDFTPHALLAYADGSAITMQCHPEFEADFARVLIGGSTAPDLDEATRDRALASLDGIPQNDRLARWIAEFIANPSSPRT